MIEEVHQLIYGILKDHSPQDCEVFTMVGREMITAHLERHRQRQHDDPRQFAFATGVDTGLLMVHLVEGTLAVLKCYISLHRIKEDATFRAELQHAYEEYLIKHNVPPTLAHLAAQQSVTELMRIIIAEISRHDQHVTG